MNRFERLGLPEKLWTEVHNIVQEAVTRTTPKKKKCREAKWLSMEALQTAKKRREAKDKGEKGGYTHLNAEFQRISRSFQMSQFFTACGQNIGISASTLFLPKNI